MNYKQGYTLATLQAGRSRVRFPMGSLGFYIDLILPDCNRNEYQECLLRGTGGQVRRADNLAPSSADCLKILVASTSWGPKGSV
jgi:hypothetical protein